MRDASSPTHFTNADRFMEKAAAGRWNERRWCPVWFTTWYGPFHMGMIPFKPTLGTCESVGWRILRRVALLSCRERSYIFTGDLVEENTLISGCRRLCTLGSIHLPLRHPPVFVRRNVAFVVSENSMPLFRNSSHAKLSRARIIANRVSLYRNFL